MRTVPSQFDLDNFLMQNSLHSYGIKAVRGYAKTGPYIKVLIPPSCEYMVGVIPEVWHTSYGPIDVFVEIVT